ncbi:N-glycosylase/DNA lyase at N-terminal half [Coccomyxa sp. Obi]|nr:N-glycosylase/DNA lyase at N-terminal half [Coccomyxa sp. Obi]
MGRAEVHDAGWQSLSCPPSELRLEFTLPTGQSFRWRKTAPQEYTGVIQERVVQMRQEENDVLFRVLARGAGAVPCGDAAALHDYFNLGSRMADLTAHWAERDPRFRSIHPYFPGARVLRQDPVECLFQFVCSSNNHISRIHGMVERLCRTYGTPLPIVADANADAYPEDLAFYAFPTLENLEKATDEALRAEGFGYRAKFIVGSVKQLLEKEGGGAAWLQGLRQVPYQEASEALCTLPGVGPKVAACVCLFALDKHAAIPVDTHVWQLATRFYTPHLKGKTLTKPLMSAVEAALQDRFGSHAGWAHNTLFISELASHRHLLPPHLQPGGRAKSGAAAKVSAAATAAAAVLDMPTAAESAEASLGRGKRRKLRKISIEREAAESALAEVGSAADEMGSSVAVTSADMGSREVDLVGKARVGKHMVSVKAAPVLASAAESAQELVEVTVKSDADAELTAEPAGQREACSSLPLKCVDADAAKLADGSSAEGGAGLLCRTQKQPANRQQIRDWKRRKAASGAAQPVQAMQLGLAVQLVKTEAS